MFKPSQVLGSIADVSRDKKMYS